MELTRREKRELGILPRQLAWTLVELKWDGYPVEDMTADQLTVLLIAEARCANPEVWNRVRGDRDWETFLKALAEFIVTVVPAILQIIAVLL